MQPQGNSNLQSDNLYMFYVPTYFNVHYKSIVTIAMTMSPDFFASSEIQNTQMPPELWLFSAQVLKDVESVTLSSKQTATEHFLQNILLFYYILFTEHFMLQKDLGLLASLVL